MSSDAAKYGYIQARLQARHGRRPTDSSWSLLEASTDLASYLQAARGTSLAQWIEPFSPRTRAQEIERSLRADWSGYVARLATWQPPPWQDAVAWVAVLIELPAAVHLLEGRGPRRWMYEDPSLAPFVQGDAQTRKQALLSSHLGPILAEVSPERSALDVWLDRWQRLWPSTGRETRIGFRHLIRLVGAHLFEMARTADGGTRLRFRLAHGLTRLFRDYARTPVAVFCHLGLVALDLERLRGGLVPRTLFPSGSGGTEWR